MGVLPPERRDDLIIRDDLISQLQQLRRDLTALQARVTETLELAARLPLESHRPVACPKCGLELTSERRRAEHLANVHGVPSEPS